jgi:hypothetical protein
MKKLRIYKVFIIFLISLNIGTLSYFLWFSRQPHERHRIPITKVLQLTGKEAESIQRLERHHFAAKDRLMEKNRTLHVQLFYAFVKGQTNMSRKNAVIDSIAANHHQIEHMTFDYFKKVNNVCSPKQQKKLEKLILEVFSHAGGPQKSARQ